MAPLAPPLDPQLGPQASKSQGLVCHLLDGVNVFAGFGGKESVKVQIM